MIEETLAKIFINQWVVLIVVTLLLIVFAEAGYRFGRSLLRKNSRAAEGHSGSVQGAVLGLLGLLLGFSFAMAVGRYDARRTLVVEEANSIGTTWLRTDFLPAPQKQTARELLIRYTRLKLEFFDAKTDAEALASTAGTVAEIHSGLWNCAKKAAEDVPTPITASFITTLNETIDLDATRKAAMRNHVPGVVWVLLLVVATCGAWASGYGSGTGGHRFIFNQWVFPLLIGVVITLISDIDRPRQGLIGMNREPLQDLLDGMKP